MGQRDASLFAAAGDDPEPSARGRKIGRARRQDEIFEVGAAAVEARMAGRKEAAIAGEMGEEIGHSDAGAIFLGEAGEPIAAAPGALAAGETDADIGK